ncbi:molybdopterin-guanine dinucleotide biosynthesis protein A [Micromonospora acroterricola]|uniref:Molybdopterin-guanine dinucleotide biosynthesis protein A n=1 Tax=Micromonospora acroterricola TaxID=2202421 RepID=A0A317CSZ2_9ACTN|nr:nucleotidyltransferase family protein [Micromonospora acroterricola]PWR05671.1 molybdopterin-guanine dinucleotide biosynthesis protein A [Micromonospora acroterricola]
MPDPPVIAGLLLAAGAGRRYGRPKALVELAGEPLVRRGIRLLRDGGCAPVHVVLGAGADELPELPGAVPVRHDRWREGLGSSLRRGLASLPADAPAVVVILVDQPLISPVAVRRMRGAHAGGAAVAVATYAGRPGHPVLLGRATWPLLDAYAVGDRGARDLLRARPDLVVEVPCDDAGSPVDVDTPADLPRM